MELPGTIARSPATVAPPHGLYVNSRFQTVSPVVGIQRVKRPLADLLLVEVRRRHEQLVAGEVHRGIDVPLVLALLPHPLRRELEQLAVVRRDGEVVLLAFASSYFVSSSFHFASCIFAMAARSYSLPSSVALSNSTQTRPRRRRR